MGIFNVSLSIYADYADGGVSVGVGAGVGTLTGSGDAT
jgi:hypothetical protein